MRKLVLLFVTAIFLFVSSQALAAVDGINSKDKAMKVKQGSRGAEMKAKLSERKLRACGVREGAIKNRLSSLSKLVENIESNFDKIAARVENYYTNKLVPKGKTVANYNDLVADIQTKKTAVQTSLTSTQTAVSGFSCTGDDPKGQMKQFSQDMQGVKRALKDYRTSIKNLIVAVRTANGEKVEETTK